MLKKKPKIVMNAPVVIAFVFLCAFATVLNYVSGGVSNELLFITSHTSLLSPMTYIRFFTHVLGHQDFSHLWGNMTYILLLGPMLEEKYSSNTLLNIILITGFATGVFMYVFFPNLALCGASGVCFAFIVLSSVTNFRNGEIPATLIIVVILYLGSEILSGIFINDNISNMGHIIGGIVGGVSGLILNQKKGKYEN